MSILKTAKLFINKTKEQGTPDSSFISDHIEKRERLMDEIIIEKEKIKKLNDKYASVFSMIVCELLSVEERQEILATFSDCVEALADYELHIRPHGSFDLMKDIYHNLKKEFEFVSAIRDYHFSRKQKELNND